MTADGFDDPVAKLFGPPVPPHRGWFDEPADPDLTVNLLLVERPVAATFGPWHVAGALVREPGGHTQWVDGWVITDQYVADVDVVFDYLVDRGGNGITSNVSYLKIARPEDAAAVAAHFDRLFREDGHPLGFTGLPPIQPDGPGTTTEHADGKSFTTGVHVGASAVGSGRSGVEESETPATEHTHGALPFPLADALSWQVVTRLIRRHPDDLWLVRTYFEAGGYDLLTVRRLNNPGRAPQIRINRRGTGTFIDWFGDPAAAPSDTWSRMCWRDALESDSYQWYADVERAAGLPVHTGRLPASTPSSIALRWIGAFIAARTDAGQHWDAITLPVEFGPGRLPEPFAQHPEAVRWAQAQPVRGASQLVWFLRRADRVEFAVGANGRLWRADGISHDLLPLYRRLGSSLTRLLEATAGDVVGR